MGRNSKEGSRSSSAAAAKLRELGLIRGSSASPKAEKLQFRLFFPRPPYCGAQYNAAKGKDGLYNFVGLVLGHHGTTIQRLQRGSGAKIEIHRSAGNLNGDHPALDDASLHALVQADTKARLQQAVDLLLEVLAPTNTTHRPFPVAAGGSAVLQPVPLPGHEDKVAPPSPSGQQAAEEDAAAAAAAAAPQQAQQSPPNAWLDRAAAKSRQQAAAAGAAAPATPPKHLAPACSASRSPFQSCMAGPSDAVVTIGPAAACSSRGGPPEPSTSSGSTATGPGGCGALGAGCASGGYVSESSGEATGLREWSMWDSASSPSLFESLHSVVAQGSQPLGGGSGSSAGAQDGAAASSGWQQPTPLGLPFPTAPAWPSTPPGLAMPQQQGPVPMALDTHPFCWGSMGW